MFRVLWRFPLYGSSLVEAPPPVATTTESFAFPLTVFPTSSSHSFVYPDLTRTGHKE